MWSRISIWRAIVNIFLRTRQKQSPVPENFHWFHLLKLLLYSSCKNSSYSGNCVVIPIAWTLWITLIRNDLGERLKPGYISQHFALILKKSGLRKIRFHDLRHSCATLLYTNGVDLKCIQEWLGHSTIGTTANLYTHFDYSQKINTAKK